MLKPSQRHRVVLTCLCLNVNQISMVLNNESFYLWKSSEPEAPSLLEFQPKYGKIVTYEWFGDTLVLLGFQNGYCVVISAKTSNLSHRCRNIERIGVGHTLNCNRRIAPNWHSPHHDLLGYPSHYLRILVHHVTPNSLRSIERSRLVLLLNQDQSLGH